MSLDCYPLGDRRVITITEQPLTQDVVYNDDLLITVIDHCRTIVVFDLRNENTKDNKVASFNLGDRITIEQVVYSSTGDYIACICHEEDILSVNTVFNWRGQDNTEVVQQRQVHKIDFNRLIPETQRKNLSSIGCCQKSGNLAIGCGETVLIYRYIDDPAAQAVQEDDSRDHHHDTIGSKMENLLFSGEEQESHFQHIISIKLTISVLKLCILENYVSITAADHVQVLKLELIPLQIQPDEGLASTQRPSTANYTNNTSSSFSPSNYQRTSTDTDATNGTLSSILSDSNSARDGYSLFNTTAANRNNNSNNINNNDNNNNKGSNKANQHTRTGGLDDISIITKNNKAELDGDNNRYCGGDSSEGTVYNSESVDGCITWNLNTKRLVKLPTLMHNSSTNLSSYHICHPMELLGPASETIACRVSASIYSDDFCQNQLEAIVMLCKHFDNDSEPVKASHLHAIYLSNNEDQQLLNKSGASMPHGHMMTSGSGSQLNLLKSKHYQLINSVTCFVTSLTNCYVYSLSGKRVQRTQIISLPSTCVDMRPDLLNVHLLTTLGLQTCSSGICDSIFCYDWCSSADLNLSFIAIERTRVLTSSSFIVLVSCSINGQCELEYIRKPSLAQLYDRIVETVEQCYSVSVRANMLTYLHASIQLHLLVNLIPLEPPTNDTISTQDTNRDNNRQSNQKEAISILKTVTSLLCKQLLLKKQSNSLTNSRIDKAIIHLLDISKCDVSIVDLTSTHQ